MKPPDERLLQALIALDHYPPFRVFLEWLQESYIQDSYKGNRLRDEVESRWMQGGNQRLEEILKTIRTARSGLDKMKNNQTPKAII